MISTIASIAAAGAIASVARYGLHNLVFSVTGEGFWGTLAVNIIGSFLMGLVVGLAATHLNETTRLILVVGFLSTFTTFSTFTIDIINLWQQGAYAQSAFYMLASVAAAILALLAGLWLAKVGLNA